MLRNNSIRRIQSVIGNKCIKENISNSIIPRINSCFVPIHEPNKTDSRYMSIKSKPTKIKHNLSFDNAKEAYKSKSTGELIRAYFVYQLVAINFIADNQMKLMKTGEKLLGVRLFEKLMKLTFFGHFVAGVDEADIAPKIQRMRKFGVNAILDYSAEKDVTTETTTDDDKNSTVDAKTKSKTTVRTYSYHNEQECDGNMEIFLKSIKAVADATDAKGFAAIKMTAIARPQLLLRVSESIERVHSFVEYITGVNEYVGNKAIKIEELKTRFENAAKEDPEILAWLNGIEDRDASGIINLLPWKNLLLAKRPIHAAMRLPNPKTGKFEELTSRPFTPDEVLASKNALKRLHRIFTVAKEANVRVMVDAEQTYLQPAISRLTIEMMRLYNVDQPIVYNTYQCYLKKAYKNFTTDLNQAQRQDFYFGAKLVRGAYMEQERLRAKELGYPDPINASYGDTTAMFLNCMDEALHRIQLAERNRTKKIKIMAATHNEDTIRFVISQMKKYGIEKEDRLISFGQLYGMCDHISFPLGESGYSVYKYVPYGPVRDVLPYLSRRASENRGFMGKTVNERKLIRKEVLRRILSGKLRYNPETAVLNPKHNLNAK